MNSDWGNKGCAVCRKLWESGHRPQLVTENISLHTRLYRCEVCGTYWEENERYADVLSPSAVEADYPGVIEKE